ncbi:MAG: DNA gyrase subunit A [archaeon]
MRYCVTGDTLINTDKGLIPIKSLSDKEEDEIKIKVLSIGARKNKASRFFNSGKHKIISIKTKEGYELKGTYNHPILCFSSENEMVLFEWKLLENISEKDYVCLNRNFLFSDANPPLFAYFPKKNARTKEIRLPEKMSANLAFLLGALVSEGSFHQDKIFFCNSDIEYYNRVKNIIYDEFNGIQLYERKIAGNCLELCIYHKNAVDFLINIGFSNAKSENKRIPFIILQSKKETITTFLEALFEGDGSVKFKTDKRHGGKSIELTYNSKSSILIKELKIVLLSLGIATTKPYIDKRNGCLKLIISGVDSIRQFKEQIGFFSERKNKIIAYIDSLSSYRMSKTDFIPFIATYLRKKYNHNDFIKKNNFDRYNNLEKNYAKLISIVDDVDGKLLDDILKNKYYFNVVASVEKIEKTQNVYSVKVESSCHSFTANGFINHNTEAKLAKISDEVLADIEKETVDFQPNFDESLHEPKVLPTILPNLLVNGSSGIAVGMATNVPPHNLTEVCDAAIELIKNPELSLKEITQIIKGPDFPTGGIICGKNGMLSAYTTGRGIIKVRAKASKEEKHGKIAIIITEIPYMINKSSILEEIADQIKIKAIEGISALRDESDRDGMRIVMELKRDANYDIVLNQLFKHSRLEATQGIRFLALVNNVPRYLNIKQLLEQHIAHREVVITRRTKYDLRKAEERSHVLEGLIIALNNIDEIIAKIKASENVESAKATLVSDYTLTEIQAAAILDMKLQKLASLEQEKIRQEHTELMHTIEHLKSILEDRTKILTIISEELLMLKEKYGDDRRTNFIDLEEDIDVEDLITREDVVVIISHSGYIKRLPLTAYKQQFRGGKGVIGGQTKEEDFIEHVFIANTHSYLLIFTNKGNVYWLKVYKVPEEGRYSKGKAIVNLIEGLSENEKISKVISVKEFDENHHLLFATKKGIIKKTNIMAYSRPRQGGIIAINLEESDDLIGVVMTDGQKQIMLASKDGQAVKFNETDARPLGRNSKGVIGMRLKEGDEVIGVIIAEDDKTLLTITSNGYGKRTPISDYRIINRGGSGVINIQTNERNGGVVVVKSVTDEDELILMSQDGMAIRTSCKFISVIGRNTQGVRLMKLNDGDKIIDAAKIINGD